MKWAKSNFLGNRCLSFSFFFCLFLMFADLPSHAQSQAMKRGRDWMDLKRYDEAISEFAHAIREEPKNVEARYLVARCYHLKNDPLSSLNWIRETLSVAPNHSAALSLRTAIQTEGIGYLGSSDKRMQSLGLQIVEQVPSNTAIPALRSLMASSDRGLASASEKLMLRIDARQARAVWISWLSSSDLRLKETGAERLWASERYPQAAPILREKYERVFMAAQEEYGAKQAASKLADFGWPEAVDILAAVLRPAPKIPQAVIAADMFGQRKERHAVPALMGAFSAWLPGKERGLACSTPYPELAHALALIGAKEAVRLLKEALSNYLSSEMAFLDSTCVETYLGSLATLDGDAWKSFKYFYGGWTEHGKVILDLEGAKGDRGTGTGQDPVDENSPNAQKIRAWLQKLGPVTAFGEGIRLETLGNYVKIQSPTEMHYYGETNDYYKIRGAYLLILRATEDPKRAWVVTDVQERPCDRCGQMQEMLPASLEGVNPSSVKPPPPGGQSPDSPTGASQPGQPPTPQPVAPSRANCSEYSSCIISGREALRASQWNDALAYFQKGSQLDPAKGDAWAGIGAVYFETARYDEAAMMLDKALELGSTVSTEVCRQHLMSCDRGSFRMSTTEVSFVRPNGQKVFSARPGDVTTQGAQLFTLKQAAYVGVRVSGKNYGLFYIPDRITCNFGLVPECPEPGFTQQKLFANYVHRTILKMAAGEFAKTVQPPAAAGTTKTRPVVPGGTLGPFRHGTLVMKVGPQDLELAPSSAQATNTHVGVDLVGSCGTTPIYAFSDGVVEDLIDSPNDSNFKALGYMVLVRHNEQIGGRETRSIYLHMDQKPKVRIGESVLGGSAILGVVGQTGAAQGCHTHFEVRHFAGRLLQDPGWNDPANIYGKGDQRSTARFRDNWEDPETISRQYSRPLI